MSQWTHINAVIRFDSLRAVGLPGLPNLGNTCTYESDRKDWDDCNVPMGSEGSMQYQVWDNPHTGSLAAYTAMFWGDLRDYEDDKEILEYFARITKGQMIRSGLLEIDIEGSTPVIYSFDRDECVWKPITPTTY